MQAPHPNRRRTLYVDPNGVYLTRTGEITAPFQNLTEALATALPDTAYADYDDFQRRAPVLVLMPGDYNACELDRSVILRGGIGVTLLGLTGSARWIAIENCGLPSVAIEASESFNLRGCSEVTGILTGQVEMRNCDMGELEIVGGGALIGCITSDPLTASGDLRIIGGHYANITSEGIIMNAAILGLATAPEEKQLVILNSIVGATSGAVVKVNCGPRSVFVPTLIGATETEAGDRLDVAGLIAGGITSAFDPEVALGLVISCDPSAGTKVEEGTHIALVFSLGVDPES